MMDALAKFWDTYGLAYSILFVLVVLIIPAMMETIKKKGGLATKLPACVYWFLGLLFTAIAVLYVDNAPGLGLVVHSWYGMPLHLLICWWIQKDSNMVIIKRVWKAMVARSERKLKADLDGDGNIG